MVEYEKRYNELKNYNSYNYWKPKPGIYKITFLSEAQDTEYIDSEGVKTPQIEIKIKVTGGGLVNEEFNWTMAKGRTIASVYGQVMILGSHHSGLDGREVDLVVKSDGQKNDYTILQAQQLSQEEEKEEQGETMNYL